MYCLLLNKGENYCNYHNYYCSCGDCCCSFNIVLIATIFVLELFYLSY